MKFETGQTSEPTSANISVVSRSSKRGPTMLSSFAQQIHSRHQSLGSTQGSGKLYAGEHAP